MITKTEVGTIFNGFKQSYIYVWVSKQHRVVYVGMTNSRTGVLGRAVGHVGENGTLRKRVVENKGFPLEWIADFNVLSFPLPSERIYYSLERSYREAVEYLVQKELIKMRGKLIPSYDVISWVRNNPRTSNSDVIREANKIVIAFVNRYPLL